MRGQKHYGSNHTIARNGTNKIIGCNRNKNEIISDHIVSEYNSV